MLFVRSSDVISTKVGCLNQLMWCLKWPKQRVIYKIYPPNLSPWRVNQRVISESYPLNLTHWRSKQRVRIKWCLKFEHFFYWWLPLGNSYYFTHKKTRIGIVFLKLTALIEYFVSNQEKKGAYNPQSNDFRKLQSILLSKCWCKFCDLSLAWMK